MADGTGLCAFLKNVHHFKLFQQAASSLDVICPALLAYLASLLLLRAHREGAARAEGEQ